MLTDKEFLEIMLCEYGILKDEMKFYMGLFHSHTNFATIYGSLLTGVIGLAVASKSKEVKVPDLFLWTVNLPWPFMGKQVHVYEVFWFFLYLALISIGCFFVGAILSYIYAIEVLATRAAFVERNINSLAGRALLVWEMEISPRLIRTTRVRGVFVTPSALRIGAALFLLLVTSILQALTARTLMGHELGNVFIVLAASSISFFAIQGAGYQKIWVPYVAKVVEHESSIRNLIRTGDHEN